MTSTATPDAPPAGTRRTRLPGALARRRPAGIGLV
jgi:hypothetical protein